MSENTLNAALRRLGYSKDEATTHGFRSTAAVRLNETRQWSADAIERQLAHQEANSVRRAYTHAAEFWPERREMMQVWADQLDQWRDQHKVLLLEGNRRDASPTVITARAGARRYYCEIQSENAPLGGLRLRLAA